jgi:exoribonuclease R
MDLRGRFPRVYAIDTEGTDFRDDAVAYDPTSRTVCVHIADLSGVVLPGTVLDDVARLRLRSIYSGAKQTMHMLPPQLLHQCSLSATRPNECLSALLQLDAFGRIRHSHVVRSVIPPVSILSFGEVDATLADRDATSAVHTDLRALATIFERRELVADWADQRRSAKSTAQRVVQGALGLYSVAAKRAAQRHNMLRLPHTAFARIATAPMRRYSDLVAQRQLTSALCMQPGMPSAEVAVIDRWIKQRQADLDKAEAAVSKGELLKPYQRRSS